MLELIASLHSNMITTHDAQIFSKTCCPQHWAFQGLEESRMRSFAVLGPEGVGNTNATEGLAAHWPW